MVKSIYPLEYDTRSLKHIKRRRSISHHHKLGRLDPYLQPSNPKPMEEST